MKKIIIIAFAIVASMSSCKKSNISKDKNIDSQINSFPMESLSDDEKLSLQWMREEEKLAHDVYIMLYNKWNVTIFTNIANSEQTHTTAVLTLLKKYSLTDPVGSNVVGVFEDSTLQNLYTQLVAQGSISTLDAFKVGATIEDLDIFDLNNWKTKVDNQDIKYVYENLTKGSRNHMRSFYSQIISSGGSYTAQFITQSELDSIINSSKETGSW
jgi:hypothetical protein